ncbi:MAG: prepilin-type N-terminal cleavage/methylation domain-containing protein [Deltaproteobacteria bacterium]|nr:prepilin-type N-terminal cleavage/methylation domain-containing protein [Deltaproteobacteria bacterium]
MSARGRGVRTGGFTLLEVMVSLAILALSLTVIAQSHQASMRATARGRMLTLATMLGRLKMVEMEDKLFDEGFSDFEKKEQGTFKEQGHEGFRWELTMTKVQLPAGMNAESVASAVKGMAGQGAGTGAAAPTPGGGGIAGMGAKLMGTQLELFRSILEQSIRRGELKVFWKEGKSERSISVVGYFTDPRKVDAAGGGLPLLPGATGQPGTGQPGTGQPGTGQPGTGRPGGGAPAGPITPRALQAIPGMTR